MSNDPWRDLAGQSGRVAGRRVAGDHALSIYWALNGTGRPGVVCNGVPAIEPEPVLPVINGIELARGMPDASSLSMFLENDADREVFLALCNDIIEYSSSFQGASDAYQSLLSRLGRWQAMLARGRTRDLEDWQVRGLIGELWFLLEHLTPRFGIRASVLSWCGVGGSPKDFALPGVCVEVKTHLSGSRSHLTITSLEQLEPTGAPLVLLALEIVPSSTSDSSLTLNEMANRLLTVAKGDSLVSSDLVSAALKARGYSHSDRYDSLIYSVERESYFRVDAGFPSITRSAVDRRVVSATYELDISGIDEFRISVDSALETKVKF